MMDKQKKEEIIEMVGSGVTLLIILAIYLFCPAF